MNKGELMKKAHEMTKELTNKEIVKNLVKLQVLCVRYVERHYNLICKTHRDLDRVIMKNKLTCTYLEAINNLFENVNKYCKESEYILSNTIALKKEIENSNIKNLKFGLTNKSFNEEEKELNIYMLDRKFFMINCMVSIKELCEILQGLSESQVKQACQQERLLNTKKVGKAWLVHIYECKEYWNIDRLDNEKSLYCNFEY